MGAAKARLESACQILIDEDGVEIHRRLGHADVLASGRDAGVQVAQRLAIIEPIRLRHETFEERQDAVGAVDEAFQSGAPVGAAMRSVLIEPGFRAGSVVGRRQPEQCEEIAALEMRAFFFKLRTTLGIDQIGNRIRKLAERIVVRGHALGFDEDGPAGAETAQRVVETRGDRDQLGRRRGIEVRAAKARGALERAVFVEDDALGD
jgi:hypothetical protein